MLTWVIESQLARGRRPGYSGEQGAAVGKSDVDAWIKDAKAVGIRSIICLLADDQLRYYSLLETDLISYYRNSGFIVKHVPAEDHKRPPLTDRNLEQIWHAYTDLPKPVLVHCSAGIDRTGLAVDYIIRQLKMNQWG